MKEETKALLEDIAAWRGFPPAPPMVMEPRAFGWKYGVDAEIKFMRDRARKVLESEAE